MSNTRTVNRSFAGGEISPEMYGRIDDNKFQSGAAKMLNFIATPQGPAENRAGFEFVAPTKNNGVARLIPFTAAVDQTLVIELGDHYVRYHAQGQTVQYSMSGLDAWDPPPSGDISYTTSAPTIITWAGHGLVTGNPVRFYVYGSGASLPLPGGLRLGYTYTVNVIDANSFNILDGADMVALTAPPGGTITYTNYPGGGTPSVSLNLAPNQSSSSTSSSVGGLANVPIAGGLAKLNLSVTVSFYAYQGGGAAVFQYSTDGVTWNNFFGMGANYSGAFSAQIPLTNLNLLRVRVMASGGAGPAGSVAITGQIASWSVDVPATGAVSPTASLRAYRYYTAGDITSYGGVAYTAVLTDSGGLTTPGTDATIWAPLPLDLTYEIPTPYAAADLFDIHYVQSNDVVTLVHPKYPPMELRHYGDTKWTLSAIVFTPTVLPPATVSIAASPGFKSKITSMAGSPAIITTVANHTLSVGDGIYISGETGLADGFYQVALIPKDTGGAQIPNQLSIVDYDGNNIGGGTYSGSGTIQYGSKIYDIDNYYVVTTVDVDGIRESQISSPVHVIDNLYVSGSYNTISWTAVPGVLRYYVYKRKSGLYGYIGQTTDLSFVDNNIAPDMGQTPPIYDPMFGVADGYPGAVSYVDQRRAFGGSSLKPQNIWMTKSGTESDFSYSLPVKDSDRIAFRIAAREKATIRHIVPMTQCILLTDSSEIRISPVNSDAITPTTVSAKPQSYTGANNVQPSIVNNSLVFCAARGGHVRELGYSFQANGFVTGDLSIRATHLFDKQTIVDQTHAKAPRPILWFVSSSGNLLGLTYVPEEQIGAWHQHTTDGTFESVAAISEGKEDRLYAVINRTVNGVTVRYIERMASRLFDTLTDCIFMDASLTYSGAPATVFSGLGHIEGKTVSILGDGAVFPQKVVTGGSVTIEHACSTVHIGLPYDADLNTLPLTMNIDGFGQGRTKNINKAWVRVYRSSGVFVGYDADHLIEAKQRTSEPYGSPPELKSDEMVPIMLTPSWQESGQVYIRQSDPLPLTIVGMTLEVAIGG